MGETIGEEAIVANKRIARYIIILYIMKILNRNESAKAMEETCVCEFSPKVMERFKQICYEKHLKDDYLQLLTIFKKNYLIKKSLKNTP